ncbi:MAG: NAD-dependent deacylase [Clostridia bacterium]|nr:NAD-dependent deacylase [Clostridia bacterium]
MERIIITEYKNIVVLTGAGVSVASGIPSFRGPGGIWENSKDIMKYSDCETFKREPLNVWRFWGELRQKLLSAEPNIIHNTLAEIEKGISPGCNFILATQNVDGLHKRAGSENVAELHGRIHYTRCSNPECSLTPFYDVATYETATPNCSLCGQILRPDIVLFGEYVDIEASYRVKRVLRDCDLFIAIGTSGVVDPAAGFVRSADYAGARTVYVNLEPMIPQNPYFKEAYIGRAEDIIPSLFKI